MKDLRRPERMPAMFLASVTSLAEAEIALAGGADVIDCKDPSRGALGALPHRVVRSVREDLPASVPVSATIGDLPMVPGAVTAAAEAMAETGVDFIKIGFFPGGDARAVIRGLGAAFPAPGSMQRSRGRLGPAKPKDAARARLVGLLLADCEPDLGLVADMAAQGFAGVMLDTRDKSAGPLTAAMARYRIALFIREAHRLGLFAGLAGSLRLAQVGPLAGLGADLLGFRGALCNGESRTGALDRRSVIQVRRAIDKASRIPAALLGEGEPA